MFPKEQEEFHSQGFWTSQHVYHHMHTCENTHKHVIDIKHIQSKRVCVVFLNFISQAFQTRKYIFLFWGVGWVEVVCMVCLFRKDLLVQLRLASNLFHFLLQPLICKYCDYRWKPSCLAGNWIELRWALVQRLRSYLLVALSSLDHLPVVCRFWPQQAPGISPMTPCVVLLYKETV